MNGRRATTHRHDVRLFACAFPEITETLRRVFVDRLGVSPKAYRDRFRTALHG